MVLFMTILWGSFVLLAQVCPITNQEHNNCPLKNCRFPPNRQGNQGSGMMQGWQYSFPNVEACVQFLWLGEVFCWVTYSVLSLNFSLDPFIYCKKCLIFNYVGLHQVWSAWFLVSCTLPFMVHYVHGSQKLDSYQMHFRSVRSIKDPVLTSMHWV